MTIDSFIQIAALIIAIYALAPRVRQLELRIRIGIWESIIGIIYLLLIIYLLFYETFLKIGVALKWPFEDSLDITPAVATFPITVLFLMFFWWRLQTRIIPRKSIFKFQELAEEFLQRGEYSELISLLDRYWESLLNIYYGSSFLYRLKNRLEKLISILSPEKDIERLIGELSIAQRESMIEVFQDILKSQQKTKNKKSKILKTWGIRDGLRNVLRKTARFFVWQIMRVSSAHFSYQ